jgi:cytochrome c556
MTMYLQRPVSRATAFSGLILTTLMLVCAPATGQDRMAVPMPGPWGDTFSEMLDTPESVSRDMAIQRYRRQQMRALSAHYRSIEQILRYDAPYGEDLPDLVSRLGELAERLPDWFREVTPARDGQGGALPRIWRDPAFDRYPAAFREEAQRLREYFAASGNSKARDIAADADALEALNRVRHQCLACHDAYRRR